MSGKFWTWTFVISFILLMVRLTEAGYCQQSYSCSFTAYRQQRYSTRCGKLGWRRCTRYRQTSYTAYKACYRNVCCSGFTGSSCSQPICYGSTSCPNGGSCTAPNNCVCKSGFSGPRCADINECQIKTDNCQHVCTNTHGSFKCSCRTGYSLNPDSATCTDIDECKTGTHNCQQICTNTIGSFTCSCRSGYTLDSNKATCTDIDECLENNGNCTDICKNDDGSHHCECNPGLELESDRRTCKDIDECALNTTQCDHVCVNEHGSFRCECNQGYQLQEDKSSCEDINECQGTSRCNQLCHNTNGSYYCSCSPGYFLSNDNYTCEDIDDCIGVKCENDGQCLDFPGSYRCQCTAGYEGRNCQTDVNECLYLNGGCEDVCINTHGSYQCQCTNSSLDDDGISCKGNDNQPNVFQKRKIARRRLPRGCAYITLTSCSSVGEKVDILLSSTDSWYKLNTNSSIVYTYGIVFAEVGDFYVPVAISGLTAFSSSSSFDIDTGTLRHRTEDGTALTDMHTDKCLFFKTTSKDIHDFLSSGSFLATLLERFNFKLPSWLELTKDGRGVIAVNDLRTDLVFGSQIDNLPECAGASVFDQHLYNVFRFGADIALNVYGNRVQIPAPLKGNKFCLVIDICQSKGGTVFMILPPESRDLLDRTEYFKSYTADGLRFRPRGIGLSLTKDINVHYRTQSIQLWNGDEKYQYKVFKAANIWMGTDIEWNSTSKYLDLSVKGEVDMYMTVPSISSLLLDIFLEEWAGLVQFNKFAITPTIKFKISGKNVELELKDLGVVNVNLYFSIGGQSKRIWCGDGANPPGFFFSFLMSINPFRNIPIVGDWIFSIDTEIYAFVTAEERLSVETNIDIVTDIIDIQSIVEKLRSLLQWFLTTIIDQLEEVVKTALTKFDQALDEIEKELKDLLTYQSLFNMKGVIDKIKNMWKKFSFLKEIKNDLVDKLEFHSSELASNLSLLVEQETDRIEQNIDFTIRKIQEKIIKQLKDYTGAGFRFSSPVTVLTLEFSVMEVELVYAVKGLGQCNKFKKVYELLQDDNAVRVSAHARFPIKIYYFITIQANVFLSLAIGDEKRFVLHVHVHVTWIGLRADGDLLINNKGIYVSVEGNIWNIFYARIEASAELGKKWYQLTFKLKGRFLAASPNAVITKESDFEGSYLDGLRTLISKISNQANLRLTQAQDGLTAAQNALTKAQDKLSRAQDKVRAADEKFDRAIEKLEKVKDKLEAAKGPFERALEKLRKAQRKVDNLCRIKECNKICVPGVRCKMCKKRWVRYPCCRRSGCMFRVPNVPCIARNAACRGVRALAYAALEAVKIVVRVPMLAFDAAKAAVSLAQVVVDKSRYILDVAVGLLEVAKVGLEAVKGTLEISKKGLELIKKTLNAALYVFDLIIKHGLQNLLDIRNCGFEVEISVHDKALFRVSCEVNAFRLGWTTIEFWFDFRHPLTSMWKIVKSTADKLIKSVKKIFRKRKRREISLKAMAKLHEIFNIHKRDVSDVLNQTFHLDDTIYRQENQSDNSTDFEYNNRVLLFKQNCETFKHVHSFLMTAIQMLYNMSQDTVLAMDEIVQYKDNMTDMNRDSVVENMTLESAGISPEYALKDYNLTEDELNAVLNEVKASLKDDPLLNEIENITNDANNAMDTGLEQANKLQITSHWVYQMENETFEYFSESECSEFSDCLLFAFSILEDLLSDESLPGFEKNRNITKEIESNFDILRRNRTLTVTSIYEISGKIITNLNELENSTMFCASAPEFASSVSDVTAFGGTEVQISCLVTGNPVPEVVWYYNGTLLPDENSPVLTLQQPTRNMSGLYKCSAENIVAIITSSEALIEIVECPPGTFNQSFSCVDCPIGSYSTDWNQMMCEECEEGFTTDQLGSTEAFDCIDINECEINNGGCEHTCGNTEGSYECSCRPSYTLDSDTRSCSDSRLTMKVLVGVLCGVLFIVIVVISYLLFRKVQRKRKNQKDESLNEDKFTATNPMYDLKPYQDYAEAQ